MWLVRTFQWKGNWINWLEYKFWMLNFEFNLSITVSLRKVIKECTFLNYN